MTIVERAREVAAGGRLGAGLAGQLSYEFGFSIEEAMLALLPLAQSLAVPAISGFYVGAVVRSGSGSLYFGCNIEIAGMPLNQTIHAEQSAVINAMMHGEAELNALAVSAPPCGHCRQFLYEASNADSLQILVNGSAPTLLTSLLPHAFGPRDLGVAGGLLGYMQSRLERGTVTASSTLHQAALEAARHSYAPYTEAYSGAALLTRAGKIFGGPYIENAAFNPSVSPLLAAIVMLTLSGYSGSDLTDAAIVQKSDTKVDHILAARLVLERFAPGARLQTYMVEY